MPHGITIVERRPADGTRYRIEGPEGYCDFTIMRQPSLNAPKGGFLSSYGGTTWPHSWPEVFERAGNGYRMNLTDLPA